MKLVSKTFLIFLIVFSIQNSFCQELFVGANAEFYLKKDLPFTTSNTVVSLDALGKFSLEAGNTWGSLQEYVNGSVFAYANGITKLPTGNNGVYAPVTADHTGDISATYFNTTPNSGSLGSDVVAVSDVEYWELTGNAIITLPWNDNSDITNLVNNNGGKLSSVAIVGYNGGTWDLVSAPLSNTVTGDLLNGTVTSDAGNSVNLNGFDQFTFGIDNQAVLGTDDLFSYNGLNITPNPVKVNDDIRFSFDKNLSGLNVVLYDVTGKTLKLYKDVITFNGIGSLERSSVKSGIYFLKFIHEGKYGVKKIILQ